jgi:hypothetical protein
MCRRGRLIFDEDGMTGIRISVIVFNATFNNISAISWRSDLLVEETPLPEEQQLQ